MSRLAKNLPGVYVECRACGWWGGENIARGREAGGPCPWCDGRLVLIR